MSFLSKIFKRKTQYSTELDLRPLDSYTPGCTHSSDSSNPTTEKINLMIHPGDTFTYTASTYGSVGIWWETAFDNSFFKHQRSSSYLRPRDAERLCGADEAKATESFTALHKGFSTVHITHSFRGTIEYITLINVVVK